MGRQRRTNSAETMLAERRKANDGRFRARHPAVAAELSSLRRDQRRIRKRWANRKSEALPGTAETYERASAVRQGALARLFEAGDIDIDQLAAGQEIAAVAEFLGRDVSIGTMSMETRVDSGRPPIDAAFESLSTVRREMAYSAWRAALVRPAMPVLAMIIGDIGVSVAAKRYHMRNRTAKKLLIDALELWRDKIALMIRDIDHDDVIQAQRRLI